jgi:hypothetical protein
MSVLGHSLGVFCGLLIALSATSLFALLAVLRRLTRNALAALLLFLPVLATCAFQLRGETIERFSLVNYFGVLPLRYGGPFLVAWLVVRHLDGVWPRRAWLPLLAVGLVALNNVDFGIPALGATIAALVWTSGRSGCALRRLALEATAGIGAAFALVCALLLIRTGSPPHFALLVRYANLFARAGFGMVPMYPVIGLSTALFLTYTVAIAIATVRALRAHVDRALTGMLAWSGVFGLGAGAYYVGRSRSEQLIYLFPIWAFALALLTLLALRWLATAAGWIPRPGVVACLVGFGLLVCSVAQVAAPWSQLQRLGAHGDLIFARPAGQAFIAQHTRHGEPVVIFTSLGHRIAEHLGIEDVEMYTGSHSVQAAEQLADSLRALRAAGGRKLFLQKEEMLDEQVTALSHDFRLAADELTDGMQLWVLRRFDSRRDDRR